MWREWSPPPASEVRAWRMADGTVRESQDPTRDPPLGAIESVAPRGWDHDHCDFCWATFNAFAAPDDAPRFLSAGYTIAQLERSTLWICATCFDDFRERFGWTVVSQDATP